MNQSSLRGIARIVVTAAVAITVLAESWFLYFFNWESSFGGLTDDHYFYAIRGWQILYGDLPVRDFVDHGAPLFYYVAAAVQMLFGRGTLSEVLFTTTMLSISAALTFVLAARASGSVFAGLAGALFEILLTPRFYNYPKLLVYVVAIPLIWHYANKPGMWRLGWIAVVTVVGFLFRHDHGVFVAVALAALLVALPGMPWLTRLRHAAVYGVICVVLLAPYLVFIQLNGGVVRYFREASEWAARDRGRAPVVWPGLFDFPDGMSEAAGAGPTERLVAAIRDNAAAWLYYLELALPLLALLLLAASASAFRPDWRHARAKLFSVAVLAIALDAGFLRSPLGARLADPSVPLAILLAWMIGTAVRMLAAASPLHPRLQPYRWPAAAITAGATIGAVGVAAVALVGPDLWGRLETVRVGQSFGRMAERAGQSVDQLRELWRLETWVDRQDRSDLMTLALYLNACTAPTDRVLVQPYLPQVFGVSRRAFAGGHADLRPGFFRGEDAQRLTVERLQRQSVPIVLLEGDANYDGFREGFPLVGAYLDRNYDIAGSAVFDDRFQLTLLAERTRRPQGIYEPLGWPCFGSGEVVS
jgi:hypothetical protein